MSTIPEYIKEAAKAEAAIYVAEHLHQYNIRYREAGLTDFNAGFIAGAISDVAKRYAGETGMRWIKASDMLPAYNNNPVFMRVNGRSRIGIIKGHSVGRDVQYYFITTNNEEYWSKEFEDIEWLYEPLPANPEK